MLLELGTRIRSCCSVSRNDKKRRGGGGGGGGGEIIVDVVSKVAHTDTREDGWKENKLHKKGCLGNVFMILYPHFGCSDG